MVRWLKEWRRQRQNDIDDRSWTNKMPFLLIKKRRSWQDVCIHSTVTRNRKGNPCTVWEKDMLTGVFALNINTGQAYNRCTKKDTASALIAQYLGRGQEALNSVLIRRKTTWGTLHFDSTIQVQDRTRLVQYKKGPSWQANLCTHRPVSVYRTGQNMNKEKEKLKR